MVPTEEEKHRIQEAHMLNPDVPLGSAESFLLTLSSISELCARLQLWAFKMDYETIEKVCVCGELDFACEGLANDTWSNLYTGRGLSC